MTLWAINRAAHGRRENYAIKIIQIKEGFCVCESGFTMYEFFKIDDRVLKAAEEAEQKAAPYLAKISETQRYNQEKMQAAFMQAGVSESHFVATTGYGYGDRGRDVLDEVYARALGAEDALCRYNFVSGTHTLTVALFGVLRPGDTMLSVTGMPYDTLRGVIGITGDGNGSLKEFGINYEQLDLLPDGTPDYDGMETAITPKHRMVYIQRSRGYSLRPSLTVDNCYGEYVQKMEPTAVGADLMAGSLIKNPGGGIAPTGGYIAGRRDLIESCAYRLTTPGTGREIGCTLGNNRELFMGTFHAPNVTGEALKTAVFTAALRATMSRARILFRRCSCASARRCAHLSAAFSRARRSIPSLCRSRAPCRATTATSSWRPARSRLARPLSFLRTHRCVSRLRHGCRAV